MIRQSPDCCAAPTPWESETHNNGIHITRRFVCRNCGATWTTKEPTRYFLLWRAAFVAAQATIRQKGAA